MAEGPAINVGATLREAREKKGISLREIANKTRIGMMSLEALERNDLSRLPGGIFTRAFIRAYAAEVGLDPERTIQDFIAQFPHDSATAGTRHAAQVEDGEALESERQAVATAMRLVFVSIPIAAIVIYFGMRGRPPAPAPAAVAAVQSNGQAPLDPTPEPASQGTGIPQENAQAPPVPDPATQGLTMVIAPRGACWVSATVDGERNFSGLMKPGDQRELKASEEIVLNLGDAGAFAYTLNGVPGRPMGAPGEVVSKRITLANYKDYLAR